MWGYGNLKKAISIFESKRPGKIQRLFLRMERRMVFPRPSDTKKILNEKDTKILEYTYQKHQ
jgi:hypothetical protein